RKTATYRPNSTASKPGAAPRRRSWPSQPPSLPLSTTCSRLGRCTRTSAAITSIAVQPTSKNNAWLNASLNLGTLWRSSRSPPRAVFAFLLRRNADSRPSRRVASVLIRLVADQPLTADDVQVGPEFPGIGDLIFAAELETEVRDAGYVIAGNNENIAVGVGERKQLFRR